MPPPHQAPRLLLILASPRSNSRFLLFPPCAIGAPQLSPARKGWESWSYSEDCHSERSGPIFSCASLMRSVGPRSRGISLLCLSFRFCSFPLRASAFSAPSALILFFFSSRHSPLVTRHFFPTLDTIAVVINDPD